MSLASTAERVPAPRSGVVDRAYRALGWGAALLGLLLVVMVLHLGSNPVIAVGFAGAALYHGALRPGRREWGWTALAGAAFVAVYWLARGKFFGTPFAIAATVLAFCGVASIAALAYRVIVRDDRAAWAALRSGLAIPVFAIVAVPVMEIKNGWHSTTFDLHLWAFDQSLGFGAPSFRIGQLFRAQPWIAVASAWTYDLLLLFPPLFAAWHRARGSTAPFSATRTFIVAGIVGASLFHLCPGTGPKFVFGARWPLDPPGPGEMAVSRLAVEGVRNAIPSMHATWIFLAAWGAAGLSRLARIVAGLAVVLTLLATLGLGEHYLIDLVVALPLTVAMGAAMRGRFPVAAVGGALTLGWLVFLRFGVALAAPVSWTLVVLTVALPCWLQTRAGGQASAGQLPQRASDPADAGPDWDTAVAGSNPRR